MSRKKIIIIIIISLLIFIGLSIFFMIRNKNNDKPITDTTEDHNYAINETETSTEYIDEELVEELATDDIGGIEYKNLNTLTPAQSADKMNCLRLINDYCVEPVKSVEITEVTDEIVTAKVTYENDMSENVVITFDPYTTYSFMRCCDEEYWNYIQSGANAG